MSVDVAARLRSLAQDYQEGRLDLAAYRSLRAPLLDSLAIGGAAPPPADITQPRGQVAQREAITRPGRPRPAAGSPGAAENGTTATTAHAGSSTLNTPSSADPVGGVGALRPLTSPRAIGSRPLVLIAVAVVVVIGVAIALWASHDQSGTGQGASQSSSTGQTGAGESEPDRVNAAVDRFLARGDWSDASLTALNGALVELGRERIGQVASESWFQRFTDEVRRRLKEQQALAQTTLTVDNSPLAALAVTVGLDLNSPDAAIHIAAEPPPPQPASQSAMRPNAAPVAERHAAAAAAGTGAAAGAGNGAATGAGAAGTSGTAGANGNANTHRDAAAAGAVGSGVRMSAPAGSAAPGSAAPGSTPAPNATASATPTATSTATASVTPTAAAGEAACRVELLHTRHPVCHDALPAGAEGPLMAVIPAGAFDMGSKASSEEEPVHHVTIGQPFAVSVYEVSQGEFKQFCESTHRTCPTQPWAGDDYPVVNVSWDDARAYTEWLSGVTHHRYSLPTEAQWEYAARAGVSGLFPSGNELSPTDANYSMLSKQTVAARRSQKYNANAFRLVHTVGNVREWVEDGWVKNFAGAPADGSAVKSTQGSMRVARGGSYADGSARLRLSLREGLEPGTKDVTTGFRIARELP